jgi:imidazole glycerol-phosphate synthase subunit HisH
MIALIDYDAGNTASVSNLLEELDVEFVITNDKQKILEAEKIILPGVGEASSAMEKLYEYELVEVIKSITKPFLGICLGMQLLCNQTEEGNVNCLGVIPVTVKRFDLKGFKVPHMGWNNTFDIKSENLLKGINDKEYFYFAHSFYVPQNNFTTSTCNYGVRFSASVRNNNFYGIQFHPEKSAQQGTKIIKNFLELC